MPKSTQTGRLLFTPRDPRVAPERDSIVSLLSEVGLIGERFSTSPPAYLVGERFLQLISFAGCSPHIQLAPPLNGTGAFCHIRVRGPEPAIRLLTGRNTRSPRCPVCRQGLTHWQALRTQWEQDPDRPFDCPHCATALIPLGLIWKQSAGFGRLFVSVEDVFPGEAVPVPALLQQLQRGSGQPWHFFYVQD
jgi:hypothetical protein